MLTIELNITLMETLNFEIPKIFHQ